MLNWARGVGFGELAFKKGCVEEESDLMKDFFSRKGCNGSGRSVLGREEAAGVSTAKQHTRISTPTI